MTRRTLQGLTVLVMAAASAAAIHPAGAAPQATVGVVQRSEPAVLSSAGVDGATLGPSTVTAPPSWRVPSESVLRSSEYRVSLDRPSSPGSVATLQAPNRAAGIRTSFTSTGLRLVPRNQRAADWEADLGLFGGAGAAPRANGNRVDYGGAMGLSFVNDQRGLGFSMVAAAPSSPSGSVQLSMSVGGSVSAIAAANGVVAFRDRSGHRVLQLGSVTARDAVGRVLSASLTVVRSSVRLTVDGRKAAFPLSIGARLSADWVLIEHQVNAQLGMIVGSAGDVNGDGYDDLLITANHFDDGEFAEGKAWVYLGSAAGASDTPIWSDAPTNQYNANYGRAAGPAGDINSDGYDDIVVGADLWDENGVPEMGKVWVYYGSPTGPSPVADWTIVGAQYRCHMGVSVSGVGDVNQDGYDDVLIGANRYHDPDEQEGRAFLYLGGPDGLATTEAWWTEGNQRGARYSLRQGPAGDVNGDGYPDVLIGSDLYDKNVTNEGGAWVFLGEPDGLAPTAVWEVHSGQVNANMGWSVWTAGDVNGDGYSDIIVAAPNYDKTYTDEGKVYLFFGSPTGPSTTPDWTSVGGQFNAHYGRYVSTAGDVNADGYDDFTIGSPLQDDGQKDEGAVYVWYGGPGLPTQQPQWTFEPDQVGAQLGIGCRTAGDVNGDGYDDFMAGAAHMDTPERDAGEAFLFYGSATGL
jgi:hypothetical protein